MAKRLKSNRLSHLAYGEVFPTPAQRKTYEEHEALSRYITPTRMIEPKNTFAEALLDAAREEITEYKADDTVAVGRMTMAARVMRKVSHHPCAPKGTNARFYFFEAFDRMIAENPDVKGFIIQ